MDNKISPCLNLSGNSGGRDGWMNRREFQSGHGGFAMVEECNCTKGTRMIQNGNVSLEHPGLGSSKPLIDHVMPRPPRTHASACNNFLSFCGLSNALNGRSGTNHRGPPLPRTRPRKDTASDSDPDLDSEQP